MKVKILHQTKKLRLLICLLFLTIYQLPTGVAGVNGQLEEMLLEKAFLHIGQEYDVFFNYDREIVANISVEYEKGAYSNVEEALNAIFSQTNLHYQIFDKRYVAVYQETEKGIQSMKKMIAHFQGIVDEKENKTKRVVHRVKLLNRRSFEKVQSKRLVFSVSGTVTDQDGEPLIGVNIQVKGTNTGTATDFEGKFTLEDIDENAVLVVSYIGYQTQEILVAGKSNLNITMTSDSQLLDEVVVVGYGTQKKDAVLGSVDQIKSEDFNKRPITNASQALQGVAAGVHVSQLSGEPGHDNTQISVRGISSFTGSNSALVLVDGIEAPFSLVNPDDIEEISVLKDAASTAIYGARAANGVILITTKKGKKGEGQLSIDAYSGVQSATRLPEQVADPHTYINLHNIAFQVPLTGDLDGPIGDPYLSDAALARYQTYLDATGFQGTDWIDEVFNTAQISKVNVSASGGSESTNYFTSASYLDQDGISIGTGSKQGTFRLNLDTRLTDKIKIGTVLTGNYRHNIRPNVRAGGGQMFFAIRRHPTVPVQLPNGAWTGNKFEAGGFGANWDNPIALAHETKSTSKQLRSLGNLYIDFEPIKDLKIKALASGNITNIDVTGVNNSYDYWRVRDFFEDGIFSRAGGRYNNQLSKVHSTNYNTLLQATINYSLLVNNRNNFNILGGYSEELKRNETLNAATSQFNQTGIEVIGNLNPDNETAGGSANHIAFRSYFGRLNYDYLGKYLLSANFRADATSRFAPENRWGYFPSFAAGWILSEEDFFKVNKFINFLKLRGSWGSVGNQNTGSLYIYQSSIAQNSGLSYVFDNQQSLGAGPTGLANRDAIWETAIKKDVAIEGRLFNNNFSFNYNFFFETRKDQLVGFPVPALAGGLSNPVVNLASVDAWGWDLDLGYKHNIGDFDFSIQGNLSHAENKVINIAGGVDRIIRGPTGTQLVQVGHPIDQPFLIIADGLYKSHEEAQDGPVTDGKGNQTAGDIKYIDQNGDGVISQQNAADDKVPVGKPYPNLVYGCNINIEYKGIDLAIQANGVAGVDYWATYHAVEPFSSQGGIPKRYLEESVSLNPNGTLPRLVFQGRYHGNEGLRFPSTFDMFPGGYMRIKNIQLGYSMSNHIVTKIGLSKLRIYANAQNPFLITRLIDGIDPERPLGNGGSLDFNRIPVTKIFSAGINIIL